MALDARTTRLLLRLWHVLSQTGGGAPLPTGLAAMNASNAAASSPSIPYALPESGFTVEVTGQAPQLPDKGLRRITLTPLETPQDVVGLSGYAQSVVAVQASCFLGYNELTITTTTWSREQVLQCAALDLAEVVRRILTTPANVQAPQPAEGISRIVRSAVSHRLEIIGEDSLAWAVRSSTLVTFEQQIDF